VLIGKDFGLYNRANILGDAEEAFCQYLHLAKSVLSVPIERFNNIIV